MGLTLLTERHAREMLGKRTRVKEVGHTRRVSGAGVCIFSVVEPMLDVQTVAQEFNLQRSAKTKRYADTCRKRTAVKSHGC